MMYDAHVTDWHIHLALTGQKDSAGRSYWLGDAAMLDELVQWKAQRLAGTVEWQPI